MTILEAKQAFGVEYYVSQIGDSLTLISRKIYGDDNAIYHRVLTTLNKRFDWSMIKPLSVIVYLPKEAVDYVSQAL